MDQKSIIASQISVRLSKPIRFQRVYGRSKKFAALSVGLWIFGLFESVAATIFGHLVVVGLGVGLIAFVIGVLATYLYFRKGMKSWLSGSSCTAVSVQGGCSQAGCDGAAGGCLAKLDSEVSMRIAEMEKSKLALLLRRRIGVDVALPIFWFAIGLKLAISYDTLSIETGGIALICGSVGLFATRMYLASAVFSGDKTI